MIEGCVVAWVTGDPVPPPHPSPRSRLLFLFVEGKVDERVERRRWVDVSLLGFV